MTKDDKFIVTSGEDSLINVWNSTNLDCLHTLKMVDKGPSCLVLTPDDNYVIGSAKSNVGVWDIDSGEVVQRLENDGVVTCLATTSDGTRVVTGGEDGVARVFQTLSGVKEKTLIGHEGKLTIKIGRAFLLNTLISNFEMMLQKDATPEEIWFDVLAKLWGPLTLSHIFLRCNSVFVWTAAANSIKTILSISNKLNLLVLKLLRTNQRCCSITKR